MKVKNPKNIIALTVPNNLGGSLILFLKAFSASFDQIAAVVFSSSISLLSLINSLIFFLSVVSLSLRSYILSSSSSC